MGARMLKPGGGVAALILMLAFLIGAPGVGAQATPAPDEILVVHPAHIHEGSCPDVGDVVFPLNDLAPALGPDYMEEGGTPVASPVPTDVEVGPASEVFAESTTTDVDASLDEILEGEHAINVHESPETMETYLACGDISGTATDGELRIDLEEVDGYGFVGEANLMDNGDGTTTVRVSLMLSDAGS
jgi:hypothetical protein